MVDVDVSKVLRYGLEGYRSLLIAIWVPSAPFRPSPTFNAAISFVIFSVSPAGDGAGGVGRAVRGKAGIITRGGDCLVIGKVFEAICELISLF